MKSCNHDTSTWTTDLMKFSPFSVWFLKTQVFDPVEWTLCKLEKAEHWHIACAVDGFFESGALSYDPLQSVSYELARNFSTKMRKICTRNSKWVPWKGEGAQTNALLAPLNLQIHQCISLPVTYCFQNTTPAIDAVMHECVYQLTLCLRMCIWQTLLKRKEADQLCNIWVKSWYYLLPYFDIKTKFIKFLISFWIFAPEMKKVVQDRLEDLGLTSPSRLGTSERLDEVLDEIQELGGR